MSDEPLPGARFDELVQLPPTAAKRSLALDLVGAANLAFGTLGLMLDLLIVFAIGAIVTLWVLASWNGWSAPTDVEKLLDEAKLPPIAVIVTAIEILVSPLLNVQLVLCGVRILRRDARALRAILIYAAAATVLALVDTALLWHSGAAPFLTIGPLCLMGPCWGWVVHGALRHRRWHAELVSAGAAA